MPAEPEILESARAANLPAWKSLDPSNPPLALSVLPGQVVALIFGIAGMARNMKFERLSDVTMPDTWMQEVAKAEALSDEGLEHLAETLDRADRISLEDALNWIVIEDRAIRAAINAGAKKKPKAASKIAVMKIMGGIKWPELKEELALLTPNSQMRTKIGAAALLERSGRVVDLAEA